jgi:hypothetical protein
MMEPLLIFFAGFAAGSLITVCTCAIVVNRLSASLSAATATMAAATSDLRSENG